MGSIQKSLNRGAILTALLVFFICSIFALSSSWAVVCNFTFPQAPICSSSDGDDTITISNCSLFQNSNCDSLKDVIIADQSNQLVLTNIDGLSIQSGSGNDTITMEYAFGAITVPVSVVGQSGNNQLKLLNGGTQELIRIRPDGISGMIEFLHSSDIEFQAIDSLSIDSRGSDESVLIYGDSQNNSFSFRPGDTARSGMVERTDPSTFPIISLSDLGVNSLVGILGEGGMDILSLVGTEATDAYELDTPSAFEANISYGNTATLSEIILRTSNVEEFVIDGHGGDDLILVQGPFEAGNIVIFGGDYSAGNQMFYSAVDEVTLSLEQDTSTLIDNAGNEIIHFGIQEVILDMLQNNLVFSGLNPGSVITYTPLSSTDGTLQKAGLDTSYFFAGVVNLSLDAGGAGNTVLKVPGLPGSQEISIFENQNQIPSLEVGLLLPASFTGFDLIMVDGGVDDDEFDVSPLTDTSIVLDGGPHALGDELEYEGLGLEASVGDSSIVSTGKKPVSYFNIEIVDFDDVVFGEVPPGGSVEFSSAVFRHQHDDQSAVITVKRNGSGIGALSVDYATSDGTGVAGFDYVSSSGTLNWAHGDTQSQTFKVPLIPRILPRGERVVNLTLSNLDTDSGAELGDFTNALLIIESSLAGEDQAGGGATPPGGTTDGGDNSDDETGGDDGLSDADDPGAGAGGGASQDTGGCQLSPGARSMPWETFLLANGVLLFLVWIRHRQAARK